MAKSQALTGSAVKGLTYVIYNTKYRSGALLLYLCAGMTPFSFLQAVVGSGSPEAVQRKTTSEFSWTMASAGPRTTVGFSVTVKTERNYI